MNILLISNYAPPNEGGIQFVMGALAREYQALGHEVAILASDTGIPRGVSTHDGVTRIGVRALNFLERRSIPFPLFDPITLLDQLGRWLAWADAVHVHGLLYLNGVLGAALARRRGLPIVLTEHVGFVEYKSALINQVQTLALHTVGRVTTWSSSAVTVLNARVAHELRPLVRAGTPLHKIVNGVDTTLFQPPADAAARAQLRQRWNMTRPTLAFVGRYAEKKGIDLVVASARLTPEIDYVICGRDTEHLHTDLPNIRVIGVVDQPRLAAIYGAADALLLPSEGEGFPLVVQEALACALPVIVTDNATNHEYLDATVALFTARDPQAIAAAARDLLADETRRIRMGVAARAWAVANFDWRETAQRYLDLYGAAK